MNNSQWLRRKLLALEGRGYRDYKRIRGHYKFTDDFLDFELIVDYVQGDPFAAPSSIRLRVSQVFAKFPAQWINDYAAQVAIADYLTRQVAKLAHVLTKKRGSGKSGQIEIARPSQAVIRRTAAWINSEATEVRLTVGLPAVGRRITGKLAADLLCNDIPQIAAQCLHYAAIDKTDLEKHIHTFQDAEALRRQLEEKGLVAFVPKGACLPRKSGADERPLTLSAERFTPTDETVTLKTPHSGSVEGMGIKAGVTLIVGGGYHGKSTLIKAIEQGIYNHVPGDGRERVVSHSKTVKLRAEDGRSVSSVDISPLINRLPRGRSSLDFSTTNASGSTSQAAGLIEAIEAGAKVLLIDEDTAATNFMIRDRNMQALIAKDKEPITPFVDKVRQLYDDYGISTVLVMGGSGDYFSVADTVIAMENYQPRIVTEQAKAIAHLDKNQRLFEGETNFARNALANRVVLSGSVPSGKTGRQPKIKARKDSLTIGYEHIDLGAISQIVEVQQVKAIAQAILYANLYYFDTARSLREVLDCVMADIEQGGLDVLEKYENSRGDLAEFRKFELAAAINRLRTLKIKTLRD